MTYQLHSSKGMKFTDDKGKACSIQRIIRDRLKSKSWSVDDLARETGINRTSLYRFLNGKLDMTHSKLLKVMQTLSLKVIIKK